VILVQPGAHVARHGFGRRHPRLRSQPRHLLDQRDEARQGPASAGEAYRFPRPKQVAHIFDALMGAKKARPSGPVVTLDMFCVPCRRLPQIGAQARKLKKASTGGARARDRPGARHRDRARRRKAHLDDGAFWKPGTAATCRRGRPTFTQRSGCRRRHGLRRLAFGRRRRRRLRARSPVTVEVRGGFVRSSRRPGREAVRALLEWARSGRKMAGRPGWKPARVASYGRNGGTWASSAYGCSTPPRR